MGRKTTLTLLGLLVLATVAMADVQPVRLNWGSTTFADSGAGLATLLQPQILTGTNACTTETKTWFTSPFMALRWNAYVQTNRDSGYFNVLFKWGDKTCFDDRVDTVLTGCVAYGDDDTLRYQARHWVEELYPRASYRGYFIFQGTGDNSDSTRIDSVYMLPDPK